MRYVVVGTAGHIDHGKSTLVKALTGTDPDRLEEEKRRGMTIDLGFAHMDLPGGRRAGFVDVPGHERLIRTMVAGAAGVDVVLFVVAADEGVMPQTREHLDILRFLEIRRGVVALTKTDLVEDPGWMALVRSDVASLVQGTFLEHAPVIPVSALRGEGLDDLVRALDGAAGDVPPRDAASPARLPVDRAFTMPGFGTVVTGTLWSGRITPGDTLEVLPQGRAVRVRGVQSHGEVVQAAVAGQRAALNLAGISKEEVRRGDVLAAPGAFEPTALVDARIEVLPHASSVGHLMRVRAYLGSDEVIGRVAMLEGDRVEPGERAYVQVRLERPTVAARGDPLVIRRFSPLETLGGGAVVDPHPPRRRRGSAAAAEVAALDSAGFDDLVVRVLRSAASTGATAEDVARTLQVTPSRVEDELARQASRVVAIRGRYFLRAEVDSLAGLITQALGEYHRGHPWRAGMPWEDLKSRAFPSGDDRLFAFALEALQDRVESRGALLALAGHAPEWSADDRDVRAALEAAFLRGRFSPPSAGAAQAGRPEVAARMLQSLADDGTLVAVDEGMLFHREALAEIRRVVTEEIGRAGEVTVASLRDRLGTSRKYALALMEYFDRTGLTRRVGDRRVLA